MTIRHSFPLVFTIFNFQRTTLSSPVGGSGERTFLLTQSLFQVSVVSMKLNDEFMPQKRQKKARGIKTPDSTESLYFVLTVKAKSDGDITSERTSKVVRQTFKNVSRLRLKILYHIE